MPLLLQAYCISRPFRQHNEAILDMLMREQPSTKSLNRPCLVVAHESGNKSFQMEDGLGTFLQRRFQGLLYVDLPEKSTKTKRTLAGQGPGHAHSEFACHQRCGSQQHLISLYVMSLQVKCCNLVHMTLSSAHVM